MTEPKYAAGQTVTLKSGTQHRILEVYEHKPERGYRYSTMTVKPDGRLYGPFRCITDKTPVTGVAADVLAPNSRVQTSDGAGTIINITERGWARVQLDNSMTIATYPLWRLARGW